MYKITLNKRRSTWHWFRLNPTGGGFGSNYCGPKYIALKAALRELLPGTQYELVTNGKSEGVFTIA